MEKLADLLLWYVAFLFSTTLHEAAHAFTAYKLGDRTAYEGGQVTLSPIPHMMREPLGTIVVPLVSFLLGGWMIGWASAPYDPRWAHENPRSSATMSAAGPAANLLLALLAAVVIRLGIWVGALVPPESINYTHVINATGGGSLGALAEFLNIFFSLNLLLLIFNLLPIPPLDGSGVVPMFLRKNLAQKYLELIQSGIFSYVGLLVAWKFFDFIYDPLHLMFVNLLFYPIAQYE